MTEEVQATSEISKIAKLNGDFRKHYGTWLGAFLYLRSVSAVRGRSMFWSGLISASLPACFAWLWRQGSVWPNGR